jgi:bleomycin hydrolase
MRKFKLLTIKPVIKCSLEPVAVVLIAILLLQNCNAQTQQFKQQISIPTRPLKDQRSSGLCWSFATTSFFETEALRLGKEPVLLSPVYLVPFAYQQKALTYLQQQGKTYFGNGDLTFTVLDAFRHIGAVPEEVYQKLYKEKGKKPLDHSAMDEALKAYIKIALVQQHDSTKVSETINNILQSTLPAVPDHFWYKDGFYSPQEFADQFVGINPDDYIEITSFNHHPFYESIVLEVPANWNNNRYLNLPLAEWLQVIDTALQKGYSLCWDGDATEPRFNYKTGLMELDDPLEQQEITQQMRQQEYMENKTTEDHNMHLLGTALDQHEKLYYVMKNSEGRNKLGGYVYMTKNALMLKTISVLVHKNAIPVTLAGKIKPIMSNK